LLREIYAQPAAAGGELSLNIARGLTRALDRSALRELEQAGLRGREGASAADLVRSACGIRPPRRAAPRGGAAGASAAETRATALAAENDLLVSLSLSMAVTTPGHCGGNFLLAVTAEHVRTAAHGASLAVMYAVEALSNLFLLGDADAMLAATRAARVAIDAAPDAAHAARAIVAAGAASDKTDAGAIRRRGDAIESLSAIATPGCAELVELRAFLDAVDAHARNVAERRRDGNVSGDDRAAVAALSGSEKPGGASGAELYRALWRRLVILLTRDADADVGRAQAATAAAAAAAAAASAAAAAAGDGGGGDGDGDGAPRPSQHVVKTFAGDALVMASYLKRVYEGISNLAPSLRGGDAAHYSAVTFGSFLEVVALSQPGYLLSGDAERLVGPRLYRSCADKPLEITLLHMTSEFFSVAAARAVVRVWEGWACA
jgi:hypothetical protein